MTPTTENTTTGSPAGTNLPAPLANIPVPTGSNLPAPLTPAPLAPVPLPAPAPASKYPWWTPYAIGAMVGLQVLGPYELKPTTFVGAIIADGTRQTSAVLVENQILIAKSQKLAEAVAELEASFADKVGKCNLTVIFGPEAMQLCLMAVRQYHEPALAKARGELAQVEAQLRRR